MSPCLSARGGPAGWVAASQEPDGREVYNNIRYGVFVTFKANNEYTRDCFKQYGLLVDKSGWYGSMWRPFHIIGLETSVSVLSAVLRGEPTGSSKEFRGDAVATVRAGWRPDAPIVVNSSRAIIYASSGDDFAEAAKTAARTMRDTLESAK